MQLPLCHRIARLPVALFMTAVLCLPATAHAAPLAPQIAAAREKAAAAERELDELQARLELRAEEYEAVSGQLSDVRAQAGEVRARLQRADGDLLRATVRLESRVGHIYRNGGVSVIEVFLGTKSFADFLTRVDWMRRVSASDAELVSEVKRIREEVRRYSDSLTRREQELSVLRVQSKAVRAEVERALQAQAAYVRGLEREVAELLKAEEERRARAAEEARRRAAEAARAAVRRATDSVSAGRRPLADSAGPGRPEVVEVALRFVGVVDYVYGGTTPAGFDCSGLTMFCYREIGVAIPRTSRQQFRVGSHIPPDRLDLLAPGDLVFFGYDGDPERVHHVGIYVGNMEFLHAPRTGERVTISSLTARIETKADYVGASRF